MSWPPNKVMDKEGYTLMAVIFNCNDGLNGRTS